MKQLLYIAAAAALTACTSQPSDGPTIFEGRFIGYNGEFTEFFLPTDSGTFQEIQINVHEDGTFCDTIQFDKDYFDAPLFADKFMFRTCMQRGKTYHAEFDISQEGVESNYTFTGEGVAENDFVKHYWQAHNFEIIAQAKNYQECKAILDATFSPLRQELGKIDNKDFIAYWEQQMADLVPTLTCYLPFYASLNNGTYTPDADFDAFIAEHHNLSDIELQNRLNGVFTNVSYICTGIDATDALKAAASCAITPEQKELAMTMMIKAIVNAGNTGTLKPAYDYYKQEVTNAEYVKVVDELCYNAIMLAPGVEAPEIEFKDANGKVRHLSDLRGKPVYVDFWATWCGPCCKEIPHLAAFVESLGQNPEITCVSISIDDDENAWKNKIAEDKPAWQQYLATADGQKSISQKYFVQAIPRFMFFDAEGRILSINAPRPSDPTLLEQLRAMIK